MTTLKIENFGQVSGADIAFGDLTVLVGPQATGKSITLQLLKLLLDTGHIQEEMRRYGMDWEGELAGFLDLYFGEGMRSLWRKDSHITWQGRVVDMAALARKKRKTKEETLFFIPAQRVLTLRDGWPRPFASYSPGDPLPVREFSEKLRLLMEQEFVAGESLFPQEKRLKKAYRELLREHLFANFELKVDRLRSQKRLVLGAGGEPLPFMVWSAGQREFVPLLLGLYWLMPPTNSAQRGSLSWAVIEEPEMGLHPRAISVLLLLVLELMHRGYRVCLSSHSPQVLDMVWAIHALREGRAKPGDLLELFGAPRSAAMHSVAASTLSKKLCVYYFERDSGAVRDISRLDPGSDLEFEASWGGLTDFSARAGDLVARAVANAGKGAAK